MLREDILKRTEKVISAMYLVTGFFDIREPLKWKLRSLSTDIPLGSIKDKPGVIDEIITMIRVANNSGLISETNYDILTKELLVLKDEIGGSLDGALDEVLIERNNRILSYSGYNRPSGIKKDEQKMATRFIKDRISSQKHKGQEDKVSLKKTNRQNIILDIVKRKREVMIKDISPLINGFSDKTIQRELSYMVKTGILKKTGDKRWSRYSLAR